MYVPAHGVPDLVLHGDHVLTDRTTYSTGRFVQDYTPLCWQVPAQPETRACRVGERRGWYDYEAGHQVPPVP